MRIWTMLLAGVLAATCPFAARAQAAAPAAPATGCADIPLAGRALAKGATVLGPTGRPFTTDSIGMALAMRELNQHLRETGESRGLNAWFTPKHRSAFLQALDEAVVRTKRG